MSGDSFPRRVLLSVTGLSPQVLTETLYALAVTEKPRFLPTELIAVTTGEGARRLRAEATGPEGRVASLYREYRIPSPPAFGDDQIMVLRGAHGRMLEDIRTPEENGAVADQLVALVRQLTSDPGCMLIVSLAGGRKTMGFLLGYALTLFARPQDRITHVLVTEPYESAPAFWYPTRERHLVRTRDGRDVDAREARVELADIPFVRLRGGVPEELLSGRRSLRETVAALQKTLKPAEVRACLSVGELLCGGTAVMLPPQLLAWYAWTLQRRQEGVGQSGFVRFRDADVAAFLKTYRAVVGVDSATYEHAARLLRNGMPEEFFLEKNSKVNRLLRLQLGTAAGPYLIRSAGTKPRTLSGVEIEAARITVAP